MKRIIGLIMVFLALVLLSIFTTSCKASAGDYSCPTWQSGYTGGPGGLWPDTNSYYYIMKYTVQSNEKITVTGDLPSGRYSSFTTYNTLGSPFTVNGINSWINDAQLSDHFSISFTRNPTGNELPMATSYALNGSSGYLNFRIYVPNGPVTLPTITCSTINDNGVGTTNSVGSMGFPNPDNHYVELYPSYPSGNTIDVVSGKAPNSVRYWSYCTYTALTTAVMCKYDNQIPLDSNGYYHIAIGQPAQQTAIESAGYTYLRYGGTLMLRNLLGDQTTGEYAPTMRTCNITDC